jgi:hypothetical protein
MKTPENADAFRPTETSLDPRMTPQLRQEFASLLNRRAFFGRGAAGIGAVGLASVLNPDLFAAKPTDSNLKSLGVLPSLHFAPKAKRISTITNQISRSIMVRNYLVPFGWGNALPV